ncbi:PorV/PorQ family protein [candidate division WOR-3 bacterium]|uniref:PorV/PorQ family protein n=1 Tax=candidate division WOR-3 bacterium TaxID=2052148 RepID=A0A9D5K9T5_UNCW3|nr:PorV/PorQ family protein [candidate division WOR-3 bacterium]MBD3364907.1 PorV/PorQ family protein [candidate division WOR-3 bacterium]
MIGLIVNLALLVSGQGATIGMPFLKLGVGTRPVAMGEAYTAVSDDANAMFYNPAGIGMMGLQFDVSGMIMTLFEDVSYISGATVFSVEPKGRIGIGLAGSYLSTTDVARDEYGNEQGEFRIYDALGAVGVGWKFNSYLSLGVTGKFIRSRIANSAAHSVLGDFGLKINPTKFVYFGLLLQHLGTPRIFESDVEFAPTTARGGLALYFPSGRSHLLFASDLIWPIDEPPSLAIGAEGKLGFLPFEEMGGSSGFIVHGGYRSGYHLGEWGGWSIGIGYEYEATEVIHLTLEAVYFSYGYLGSSERLSLGVNFRPD